VILLKRVNITDRVAVVNVVVAVLLRMRVVLVCRSLVSASQDGKLIVWDGYTTNKARKILPTYLFAVKIVKFVIMSFSVYTVNSTRAEQYS